MFNRAAGLIEFTKELLVQVFGFRILWSVGVETKTVYVRLQFNMAATV
jgi:hypothetical protein